jgi:uncharacterized protein (DUF433 family)
MRYVNTLRFKFPDTVPLVQWEDGSIRVKDSRVTLDTIIGRFHVGDTLDEIHDGFPTVSLAQTNAIIGWYLNNQTEVDAYLEQEEAGAERVRLEIQSRPEYKAFRKILERRREEYLQRRRDDLIET